MQDKKASSPLFALENYQIDDSIGFLMTRARLLLVKSIDEALVGCDITYAQGGILYMLSTGRCASAADLAREFYIDAASMKRSLDRLEARQLIVRQPNPQDRRQIRLSLTPDGEALAQRMPVIYVAVLSQLFADFSAEEVGFLKSLLRKFLAHGGL
ncbi:MarR family winged helix-turn-helix transcriptional regulator [Herminiimonas sp. CN]|uniref:MarR family winged helix-turn-helix transcriptional regulator n=1 Tax=Herminiimonas sp. CN TaxID=1349818 RepID=UPI000473919D|nr:MarR family transcriptional regulator [Herminiimonas sp. CN]